jgi:hypothetical protein
MSEALAPAPAIGAPVNRSSEELRMRELIAPVLRAHWPEARIIHELPLRYSERRIDMAAVTRNDIFAVEIKSSRDVLDRLEEQLRRFAPICSAIFVALAPCHRDDEDRIDFSAAPRRRARTQKLRASEIIREANRGYDRIETWTVDVEAGLVDRGSYWPSYRARPWPAQMLQMLHRDELLQIAGRRRLVASERGATHDFLVELCNNRLTSLGIRADVCAALRARDAFDRASDAPIVEARG